MAALVALAVVMAPFTDSEDGGEDRQLPGSDVALATRTASPEANTETTVPTASPVTTTAIPSATPVLTGTPTTPLTPATPLTEDELRVALEQADEADGSEDLTEAESVQVEGYRVVLVFKTGSILGETRILTHVSGTAFSAIRAVLGIPSVAEVVVRVYSDDLASVGDGTPLAALVVVSRALISRQPDWESFKEKVEDDNKFLFCVADAYVLHPAIYSALDDTGCLTGSSRSAPEFAMVVDEATATFVEPTPTATVSVSPNPTHPLAQFELGTAVTLTNGTGVCLAIFEEPTFSAEKLRCDPDGTIAELAEGPFVVADQSGDLIWWGLSSGGYTVERWMRATPEAAYFRSYRDNLGFLSSASDDELTVAWSPDSGTVTLNINQRQFVFGEGEVLSTAGASAIVASKAIWTTYPDVQRIVVAVYLDFTDQFGATSSEVAAEITVLRGTGERFQYDGLKSRASFDNKLFFCTADGYYIHPAVYHEIGDRGCLALWGSVKLPE